MRSYSLPARAYTKTIEWAKVNLLHGVTGYIVAVLLALFVLVPSILYMLYGGAPAAANLTTEREQEQEKAKELIPEPAAAVTQDVETELQATVVTDAPKENTQLRVNNQPVPVPDNGTIHETVQGDGNTSLNVTVNSSTNGTSSNDSSTSIQLNTKSETETEFEFESTQ